MSVDVERGVQEVVQIDQLERLLQDKQDPVIKYGVDPTASHMHLGHTVPLRILRRFQDAGYTVNLLIGDFTARVGDPSGQSKLRNMLTGEQVEQNAQKYFQQASRALDPERTKIVYNSTWLAGENLASLIHLFSKGQINNMIKRKGVATRLEAGEPVSALEFIYPFLQAYDSVAMRADIEVGGPDQRFNFAFTRDIQKKFDQAPEVFILSKGLLGKQGTRDGTEKMSKSSNNHIPLDDDPANVYGGVMSCVDDVILHYFELLTDVPMQVIKSYETELKSGRNPMEIKENLAFKVVELLYGVTSAGIAQEKFARMFKNRELPDEIKVFDVSGPYMDIGTLVSAAGLAGSKSEARRLVIQGGVLYEGVRLADPQLQLPIQNMGLLQVGKSKFVKTRLWDSDDSRKGTMLPKQTKDMPSEGIIKVRSTKSNFGESRGIDFLIRNSPIIETAPSLERLARVGVCENGSIYLGTGLCNAQEMSKGLPFDVLGMMMIAEYFKRSLNLTGIRHQIADVHAITNKFGSEADVASIATSQKALLSLVAHKLGFENYEVYLASELERDASYLSVLDGVRASLGDLKLSEYSVREIADIEWHRRERNMNLKVGWLINPTQPSKYDERSYDDVFRAHISEEVSFVYVKAGRTLNPNKQKASPYLTLNPEERIMLVAGEDVRAKLVKGEAAYGNKSIGGLRKYYNALLRVCQSLGNEVSGDELHDRISGILNKIFN